MGATRRLRGWLAAGAVCLFWVAAAPGEPPRLGVAEAPARAPGTIRLATYNILNLFDDRDDPSLKGRYDDWHDQRAGLRAKPEEQKRAVAEAMRRLDADIIGLQEIESFDALIEFREQYLQGMGYEHVVSIDVGQERGIEQAVLSRFPIREVTVWPSQELGGVHPEMVGTRPNELAGQPIRSRRSPLRVVVEVLAETTGGEPYELTLFVVHHKAGFGNDYWREREAMKLLETIRAMEQANPERNIAVLGDFNARPEEAPVTTYLSAGFIDTLGSHATDDPRVISHESGRRFDFILVNRALRHEVVEGSAFVLGTPLRPAGADWRTTPAPEGFAADHLPVAVDLVAKDEPTIH